MPDVLCLSHVLKYEKSLRGDVPGWRHADDLAKNLQDAACSGSDPPIPLALPHTRAINGAKRGRPYFLEFAFKLGFCGTSETLPFLL